MPTFIGGLPLHPLVIHAAVVLVSLSVSARSWSRSGRARRRYGSLVVVTAVVATVCTVIAEQTGEGLEHSLLRDVAITAHAELGDGLKVWLAPLMIAVAALVLLHRRADRTIERDTTGTTSALALAGRQRVVALALAVVTVVLAVGAAVAVFRVGDSGAQAVWGGRVYEEQRFGG